MSDDLAVVGLIGIAFFVVEVASYPAAVLSGYVVAAFIRKEGRRPMRGAFWTNLLPALAAPLAVGGLAGILWVLPQSPDGRFVAALAGAVAAAIPAWGLVYRVFYRVPVRTALIGAACVPLLAVPLTALGAMALGTLVALLMAVVSGV
jgi:multisubunit Na+/H+ antiporter MnhB subunit